MDSTILVVLLVWLTIGVVIGGWISIDTFKRKVKGAKWVVIGVLLSFIGLAIYLMTRDSVIVKSKAEYSPPPEYRLDGPTEIRMPRASDQIKFQEPAPVAPVVAEKVRPEPERAVPQREIPPVAEPLPDYRSWAPHIKEQLEGAPRCPRCKAAISTSDQFCSECGARLK
jgi:hypothetical protein